MENKMDRTQKSKLQKMFLGIMLVVFGGVLLAARWVEMGVFVLLIPGVAMLLWGCLSRTAGWIIPGSIVTSIGVAAMVLENSYIKTLGEPANGAIFMLIFSVGWFLIAVLTRLFTGKAHFWAMIPGSIMAVIGILLLQGESGLKLLEYTNIITAAALVLIGGFILVRGFNKK